MAGCSAIEFNYYREGIGSDLYRSDLPEVTKLQDDYVDYICRQANILPSIAAGERCVFPAISPDWTLFVQAGMNDIDQRCDHFLNWIDYKRRNKDHMTKQVADTVFAITTIARVTGSPDRSMDVLGAALGLASATFANVSARLLTVADQATVQSVVVVNQNKYRLAIKNDLIDNRPSAIHVLRSYLRICLPATIEMEINTNTVIAQRTGPGGIEAIQTGADEFAQDGECRETGGQKQHRSAAEAASASPPPIDDFRIGPFEPKMTTTTIQRYQAALCVGNPDGKPGRPTQPTRVALREFFAAKRSVRSAGRSADDHCSERQ